MKTLIKILFIVIVIFICLFLLAYAFFASQGKAIVTKQIESMTQRKVKIDYVGITPPLNLEIRNLDITGLAQVEHIFVSPSIIGLLSGNIALNSLKLTKPKLVYERIQSTPTESSDNTTGAPLPQLKSEFKGESKVIPKKKPGFPLILKQISIKDGELDFIDHTVGSGGIKITIKNIDFHLTNLYIFPRSVITNFALKGSIPWQKGKEDGKIEAEGWLNLFKKDMQATLKIQDIDGIYLYPYYAAWVDLEKTRIEGARLNLTSNIHSLNNNLTAECHLELSDIAFKPSEESDDKTEKIAAAVLDVFRALNKGKVILNFTIKTKMTNPEFSFHEVKDAFEQRLVEAAKDQQITAEDFLMFPTKVVGGTFKGATDLSKALIDGTFSIAKELKQAVEYAFKKEQPEE